MVHAKKDDDTNNTFSPHGKKTEPAASRPTSGRRSTVFVNTGVAIALFFALIQLFDPTLPEHNDISLTELLENREALATTNDDDGNVRHGRERILKLLSEAGAAEEDLPNSQIAKLPKWQHIVDLFGEQVVIVGQDECATFRNQVGVDRIVLGVAGLFNTGTNLLDTQIRKNIRTKRPNLWQVPWGKHRMAEVKWNHTAEAMAKTDKKDVLPVVIVRDPFAWLQSMCSHPYAAQWRHGAHHCPNFVPNEEDFERFKRTPETFKVSIKFDTKSKYHYDSLVHLWSQWYAQYLEADYPVLMVRFEDLVFQPVSVLQEIANCVGGTLNTPIQYQLKSSKAHGSGTDYIKALIKTANAEARYNNLTAADLDYTRHNLDPRLMKLFHYNVPQTQH